MWVFCNNLLYRNLNVPRFTVKTTDKKNTTKKKLTLEKPQIGALKDQAKADGSYCFSLKLTRKKTVPVVS